MKRIDRYKKRWNGEKYVRTHRLIAEKVLGKPLATGAVIHHFNGEYDGPIVICQNQAYHSLLHLRQKAYNTCGNSHWRQCRFCKKYDETENFYGTTDKKGTDIYTHPACDKIYKEWMYQSTKDAPLCKCGCENGVKRNSNGGRSKSGYWNKYIHGHNIRRDPDE